METLDKESGDVNGSERTEGIWPRVETHVYEMDGSDYDPKENSEKLTLTVDVTNEDELENVEVVVKDEKGNTIPQTDKIEGTEGQYSYTVEGPSGTYTVEVTGTDKEGNKKTTRKTVTLKENPRIDIDIVFDPDGGPGYVMPSNGESATIKTKMTSSEGNQEPYKYYYAWSEDNTVRPGLKEGESWTETTSGAIIEKDDCVAGKKYYLWIQVYDTRGTLTSQYVVSEPFEVHNNTEDDYKITFEVNYPNDTYTNQDVVVRPVYGKYLTEDKEITVTPGTQGENKDYTINGSVSATVKTNNQKVTATACDKAGNRITAEYTVENIDKEKPVIKFNPDGIEEYTKSHNTTIEVTDEGVSPIVDESLKYVWINEEETPGKEPADGEINTAFENNKAITKKDGTGPKWYLWAIAKDKAGNVTKTKSKAFWFDNTNPNKEKPTLEVSTNTVKATFHQTDSHSQIDTKTIKYGIKKTTEPESEWRWETETEGESGYHTFTNNIELETEYQVKTQVTDNAENGPQDSEIAVMTTGGIQKPEIDFEPKEWTNNDVKVTIDYKASTGTTLDTTLKHEYSVGSPDDWQPWPDDVGYVMISQNTDVYARQYDTTGQGQDRTDSMHIGIIDKEKPTITHLDVNTHDYVNHDITLTGNATDEETDNLKNDSGIVEYQFSQSPDLDKDSDGWEQCLDANGKR